MEPNTWGTVYEVGVDNISASSPEQIHVTLEIFVLINHFKKYSNFECERFCNFVYQYLECSYFFQYSTTFLALFFTFGHLWAADSQVFCIFAFPFIMYLHGFCF